MSKVKVSDTIQLEIMQLPPAECSPNARVHWVVKKRAGDNFRDEVFYLALVGKKDALELGSTFPWEKSELRLTIIVAQKRRRDTDNWLGRAKPGIDALKLAGLIVDDDVEHLTIAKPVFVVDKTRAPRTIFELVRGEK